MISEHDGAGTILRRYVHGDGRDEPLVWYGDGVRRYFHADERGSIVALSNDAGNVTAVNRYDEYGVPASTNAGRFQYTGQAWLPEIGLHYYKARMYAPRLGRFMQTDTLGYIDGMNLYAYVGNDPVNSTDPSGMSSNDIVVVGDCRYGWTCYKPGNQLTGAAYPVGHQTLEPYYFGGGGGGSGYTAREADPAAQQQEEKPKFCKNILYRGLDAIDSAAGYGQLIVLGGGAMGQTEPYSVARAAFRAGALKGYAALGAIRDITTVGKFVLGDGTTVSDLAKSLAVKGLGLDKAREVLADTFGILADKATGKKSPCAN